MSILSTALPSWPKSPVEADPFQDLNAKNKKVKKCVYKYAHKISAIREPSIEK